MTSNIDWFTKYVTLPNNKTMLFGDDIVKQAIGEGMVIIQTTDQIMEVKNVLHVFGCTKKTLFFMCQSTQKGGGFHFITSFVKLSFTPQIVI